MRLFIYIAIVFVNFVFSPVMEAKTLYIIGHKGSFNSKQTSSDFADYYLLKIKSNVHGQMIIPINLPINHPMRQEFSTVIFNRSPLALSEYWDRMSFRGIRPPVIQKSEKAVMLFVSRVKGAIGYVSIKPKESSKIEILGEISQ
ncbi:MAG: hypothetical protein JKX78_15425 [Alteromonadaceae bacterium]|nr:hypothetical protein [Alteromonadaceae bacterium]